MFNARLSNLAPSSYVDITLFGRGDTASVKPDNAPVPGLSVEHRPTHDFYVLIFMVFYIFQADFALAYPTYSDDNEGPLFFWRRRRIKGEQLSKALTKLATSCVERADGTGYHP